MPLVRITRGGRAAGAATSALACALLLASSAARIARAGAVPNASFEEGDVAPAGWTLSGGTGRWLAGGASDGARAISVTGTGGDSNHWRSGPLALLPSTAYRVSFRARNVDGEGGTPVTGPAFCNRDLGKIPAEWRRYTSVFFTPREIDDAARLRFGQWHVKGTIAFDQVDLVPVQPAYQSAGGMRLGEGERLAGNEYRFRAPFQSESRNHSRPLARHNCSFNTNRWIFGARSEVVYRHRIGARRQTAGAVEVGVTWHRGGELAVAASADGERWKVIGTVDRVATKRFAVPAEMLPADEVSVRLTARPGRQAGAGAGTASLQVGFYEYHATVEGEPLELAGRTRFVAVTAADPNVRVRIESIGDGIPGGDNVVVLRATNATPRTLSARGRVTVSGIPAEWASRRHELRLRPGESRFEVPYEVPGAGRFDMRIGLTGEVRFEAETDLNVADLYRTSYGERLPPSTDKVGLWWASSGWKVSRTRPVPKAGGHALTIRAARNEVEAAQLVLRPREALRGLVAIAEPLRGPGGVTIPAGNVEVLRVRYVNVTQPTDATGVAAPWPDPLPPFRAPVDVAAKTNQPLWVRVKVPPDAPAGVYEGAIRLTAGGYDARAPVRVEVYGFALPDRMTCTTAFGFSPGNVWRYQKVAGPAERRAVLEKYWASFSAHHISPYDPAPLDPVRVTWPGAPEWQGGRRDRAQKRSGERSLCVEDRSTTAQTSAIYGPMIAIPPDGLRLRFWYRTKQTGHPFIVTLTHHDAGDGWMSGRNLDMRIEGAREWRLFERTVTSFPAGARSVRLSLWGAVWKDDGSPTGTVWYDNVSLTNAGTGAELIRGGEFESVRPAELVPSFDWTAWDAAMTRAIDHYHFNSFRLRIPGLGGGSFHSRAEPSLLGYGEDAPEYRAAFGSYCRAVEAHLRHSGWLEEAFVYWFDEPDPKDYEFVTNGFRKLKEAAPSINRMLTEQPEPALAGGPNIWCPVSHNYDHEVAEARRREGDRFWWYVCCGPKAPYCTLFIDHPATELRAWLWQTWKRGIEGILVWQTNYWTSSAAYPDRARPQDPYADPMGWVSGYSTPAGTRRPWGNGDGRFIYPPEGASDARQEGAVLEGPVDSIRWEMLRDGIEDYEYLAMLRKLLARHEGKLSAGELGRMRELLEVPESISRSMTEFTKDPAAIEIRRNEVALAIEKLSRIP